MSMGDYYGRMDYECPDPDERNMLAELVKMLENIEYRIEDAILRLVKKMKS